MPFGKPHSSFARVAMFSRAIFPIAFALLCGCAANQPIPDISPKPGSEAQIRSTLVALNAACAARDLDAFMALFDESDEILFVGSDKGEVFRGREAIRGFMRKLYDLSFVFSFELNDTTVHQEGEYGWLFVDGTMIRTGDRGKAIGKVGKTPYRFSIVMIKRQTGWKWQLFNGSVPGAE